MSKYTLVLDSSQINEFSGTNRFLSNFYIEPDRTNVEAEYQRFKCQYESDKLLFTPYMNPFKAKQLGRKIKIRADWELIKLGVMWALVLKKFEEHPELKKLLLDTKDKLLIEGNHWNDTYWGVCNGKGLNHLGNVLMTVRKQLQNA